MVEGDPQQLTHAEVVNQVRTLLLTGIRSAMLWRQCGGKRYQILFGGNRLLRASKELTLSIQ
jgi:high frequency lysogenization protein